MKFCIISDKYTGKGFQLVGFEHIEISKDDDIKSVFTEITKREDIGCILITEQIAKSIKDEIYNFRKHHHIPIIFTLPGLYDKKDEVKKISDIIKETIGFKV